MNGWLTGLLAGVLLLTGLQAEARVSRIVIDATERPADGGERLTGRAFGEVDPDDPANAIITDLRLAPRNAAGRGEARRGEWSMSPASP